MVGGLKNLVYIYAAVVPLRLSAVSTGAETPAKRFVAAVSADPSIPEDAKNIVRSTWEKCDGCNEGEFMAQALSLTSARFRDVLETYDEERFAESARLAGEAKADSNRYTAIYAAGYEALSLVAAERFEAANRLLGELLTDEGRRDIASHSYLGPELAFLRGFCLVADLQFEEGEVELNRFLDEHPDAPIRLTIAARQMLHELLNREPGKIGEVVDLMKNSHGRLQLHDSGKVVQARQQRILDLLDKLIKDAEDNESKCKCKGSKSGEDKKPCPQHGEGQGQQQQQQQGQKRQQTPMQESRLPGGTPSAGALRDARRANPADSWGAMPPLERERILQALRESFPSRYRQLVEQYYEELAKKP